MSRRGIEYHRPSSLGEALSLLVRDHPRTQALAGGTHLAFCPEGVEALVDLRDLSLAGIGAQANEWRIGSMTPLAGVWADLALPQALRQAARREVPGNLQTSATVGGTVALRCSGPFLCALLALGASLDIEPGQRRVPLEDLVLSEGGTLGRAQLIVGLGFPRDRQLGLAEISRTPQDRPLMCLSIGGRRIQRRMREVRVACGAFGQPLVLIRELGKRLEGQGLPLPAETARLAIRDLGVRWTTDIRGSSQYRDQMMPVLLKRAADQLWES